MRQPDLLKVWFPGPSDISVDGWLERELAIAPAGTTRPWGVGFQSWAARERDLRQALAFRPAAVMLSFSDPAPLAPVVRGAGALLIIQVTDLAEARQAIDAGADVIVAQGTEAGGHGGGRSLMPFLPVVADLAAPVPVLAAGGIADGRGLAAGLALGAAGALVGTRFLVAAEALTPAEAVKAILEHGGEDTLRTRVSDVAREAPWPSRYPARTIRNAFFDQWNGREDELAADPAARAAYRDAIAAGRLPADPIWASEAIDLITGLAPAGSIVADLVAEAHRALAAIVIG